jgi:hypothetical protein
VFDFAIRIDVGMKVERKLSDFSAEKQKWNKNMETKMEICGTEAERKRNFFGGSGNGNGTAISGGTDAEKEVSVSD